MSAGKPTPDTVCKDLSGAYRIFAVAHSGGQRGGVDVPRSIASDEFAVLAARLLLEAGARPSENWEQLGDLRIHDSYPQNEVTRGVPVTTPKTRGDYDYLTYQGICLLEGIARSPGATAALRELVQDDVDRGVRALSMLRQITLFGLRNQPH